VRFATNGREAIEQVRTAVPDIVLMDIRMPEMDGPTALAEIRKLPGAELLPVIAVTASSMVDDEHRYRGNFAGYLRKPFTRPMLYREMAYFLPKHVAKSREAAQPATATVLRSSPAEWPALVSQLRKLQRDTWPNVRDGGAIPDAKNFAAKLRDLGRTRECPPLQEYADALLNDAENFAVHELEKQISRFPAVVEQIAERAQSAVATETAAPTLPA
jgi:CheY-like chemotaxis protein